MVEKGFNSHGWNLWILFVLISISLLNWILLGSFQLGFYYTVIPLLFAVQLFLNTLFEYLLLLKVKSAKWFSILVSPGTILHEISHAAAVVATGGKVTSISLFSFNKKSGTLGSVTYVSPNDRLSFLRSVLITFAPFFGCGFAVILISNIVFSQGISIDIQTGFSALFNAMAGSLKTIASEYSQAGFGNPLLLLALYLQFCFAFGAAPSSFDFQTITPSVNRGFLGFLLAVFMVVAMVFFVQYSVQFGEYGTLASGVILLLLKQITLLLTLSSTLLFISLLLVYSLSSWLEVLLKYKLLSIIIFILTYLTLTYLLYPKEVSILSSFIAFAGFLFLVKNKSFFINDKAHSD